MNPDSEFGDRLFIAEDEAEALSERRSPEESSALGVEREKGYPKSVPKDSKRTKSRLPSSLKTNIIRSRAKFHELETSGSNVTSKQKLPCRPAIVRFSRKDDQAQVILTTGNELASDIGTGADEARRSRMKVQPSGEVISVQLVGPSTNISTRKATKPKKPPRTVGRSKNSIAENAISNTGSSEGILTSLDFLEHNVRKSRKRRDENNVETFDTFLKYPMDVPYPQTIEGFCSTSGRQENCFYENYRASVRGEGVFTSDLEDVIKKRIADTEKEIAKWSSLARKLEEQDCLGTDPFIDYIAYRLHIFIARYERDLDRLSAQLDEYCGRQQGRENEQQIDPVHLDIIREKIDDVYQRLQDHRLSSQAVELKSSLIENPISVPGQCLKSNVAGERVIKEEEPVFGADLSSTENSDIEEGIRFFDFKEETQ
uniref:Uncharacterized protein n=1 Tax=Angiostrongylus cantonensis TaxID=6313 RepID=A0A158PBF4_ANGCA